MQPIDPQNTTTSPTEDASRTHVCETLSLTGPFYGSMPSHTAVFPHLSFDPKSGMPVLNNMSTYDTRLVQHPKNFTEFRKLVGLMRVVVLILSCRSPPPASPINTRIMTLKSSSRPQTTSTRNASNLFRYLIPQSLPEHCYDLRISPALRKYRRHRSRWASLLGEARNRLGIGLGGLVRQWPSVRGFYLVVKINSNSSKTHTDPPENQTRRSSAINKPHHDHPSLLLLPPLLFYFQHHHRHFNPRPPTSRVTKAPHIHPRYAIPVQREPVAQPLPSLHAWELEAEYTMSMKPSIRLHTNIAAGLSWIGEG
ncbi:hypothetical protein ONZ45_g1901 [Pleurotus djamor]|nr:hypothetical protein ONZ45_g1901 [Pleurotus djamor]